MKELLLEVFNTSINTLTINDVLLNFAAALIMSIMIFISYRISNLGPVYSRKFNISLVMLTLVTTLVMNVIGNNIALSLGMVGALSIVRFRTAIKDPRDTAYIFWCIAVGICCGVSDYIIAAIGTSIIFTFLVLFGYVKSNERVMVVIHVTKEELNRVDERVRGLFGRGKVTLKVESVTRETGVCEIIYEVMQEQREKAEKKYGPITSIIADLDGVINVSVIMQENEITQ